MRGWQALISLVERLRPGHLAGAAGQEAIPLGPGLERLSVRHRGPPEADPVKREVEEGVLTDADTTPMAGSCDSAAVTACKCRVRAHMACLPGPGHTWILPAKARVRGGVAKEQSLQGRSLGPKMGQRTMARTQSTAPSRLPSRPPFGRECCGTTTIACSRLKRLLWPRRRRSRAELPQLRQTARCHAEVLGPASMCSLSWPCWHMPHGTCGHEPAEQRDVLCMLVATMQQGRVCPHTSGEVTCAKQEPLMLSGGLRPGFRAACLPDSSANPSGQAGRLQPQGSPG